MKPPEVGQLAVVRRRGRLSSAGGRNNPKERKDVMKSRLGKKDGIFSRKEGKKGDAPKVPSIRPPASVPVGRKWHSSRRGGRVQR